MLQHVNILRVWCARVGPVGRCPCIRQTVGRRAQHTNVLQINTNVPQDTLLFSYKNDFYFRWLSIGGIAQWFFFAYMAEFTYSYYRDVTLAEEMQQMGQKDLSYWMRGKRLLKRLFGDNLYRNTICLLFLSIGTVMFCGSWLVCFRNVRSLVLRQGGQQLQLRSYALWGQTRVLHVNVEDISCKHGRGAVKAWLPMKVKGYKTSFLLDKDGNFHNAKLFDHTACVYRAERWRKDNPPWWRKFSR